MSEQEKTDTIDEAFEKWAAERGLEREAGAFFRTSDTPADMMDVYAA